MILAAGRGERLRPLTYRCPKAMCKIAGIPLIEYHVIKLARAGFARIVINHAYLGYQIRHHLGNGSKWGVDIVYSAETPGGLETGGGLYQALPLLGDEPFLAVNADIFTSYEFKKINLAETSLAHLVLVANPSHNVQGDFGLRDNRITNDQRDYTFLGVACYHPKLFQQAQLGRYSMTPILRQLAAKGQMTGEIFSGAWLDIGSPERLAIANQTSAQ
jgi:MurNAc alpha-1-phosphate uridylyltransferase